MKALQDFFNAVFGTDKNTSATIIITLIVFFIGQLMIALSKTIERYNKRSVIRQMFFNLINEAIKLSKKQSAIYQGISDKMHVAKGKNLTIKRGEFYHLEIMNQIGFKEEYESVFDGFENAFSRYFQKKKKLRGFTKIWETLNSIEYWEAKAHEDADAIIDKINKYNENRNAAMKAYQKIIDRELSNANGKEIGKAIAKEYTQYLDQVQEIYIKLQRLQFRTSPFVLHKNLVIPMRILNRKYMKSFTIIQELNSHLLEASVQYENIYNLYKSKGLQFHLYASSFKNYYKTMRLGLDRIK